MDGSILLPGHAAFNQNSAREAAAAPHADGGFDERFAMLAVADAVSQGCLTVAGAQLGDQPSGDGRRAADVRAILKPDREIVIA